MRQSVDDKSKLKEKRDIVKSRVVHADNRQISPKTGLMLRILDLLSLARLAGLRAVRYET